MVTLFFDKIGAVLGTGRAGSTLDVIEYDFCIYLFSCNDVCKGRSCER